jgi:hypothetical protein
MRIAVRKCEKNLSLFIATGAGSAFLHLTQLRTGNTEKDTVATGFLDFFVFCSGEITINKHNVQSLLSAANLLEVLHVRKVHLFSTKILLKTNM